MGRLVNDYPGTAGCRACNSIRVGGMYPGAPSIRPVCRGVSHTPQPVPGRALKGQPSWPVGTTRNPAQGRATPTGRRGTLGERPPPPPPSLCDPPPALPCRAGGGSQSEGSGGFSFGTRNPGCRAASRRFTLGWVDLPLRGASGYINPGTQGFALGYCPPGLQPG